MARQAGRSSRQSPATASEPAAASREPAAQPVELQLQSTLGNRAACTLLAGGVIQPRLQVGAVDDPLERDADRAAAAVMGQAEPAAAADAAPAAGSGHTVQRVCCADCEEEQRKHAVADRAAANEGTIRRKCAACAKEEEDENLQRRAQPGAGAGKRPASSELQARISSLGAGRPLGEPERRFFEPRFGHDFSAVRLHTGDPAATAAQAARARAFTLGRDVVFNAAQYDPATRSGRGLLAHELAHVVQQETAAPGAPLRRATVRRRAAQRQGPGAEPAAEPEAVPASTPPPTSQAAEPATGSETAAAGEPDREPPAGARQSLLVADDGSPAAGQMTRATFLDAARATACAAAERGLSGTDESAEGCPWIEHYIGLYGELTADRVESDLRRSLPGAARAASAQDYLTLMGLHIERSVRHWAETGEITGLPEGLPGAGLVTAMLGGAGAALGGMLFKRRPEAQRGGADPASVRTRLGRGTPLPSTVRSRMEGAFGQNLGGVRLHTDARAGRLAGGLGARAFAVGSHVAFAPGEYKPGTLMGDALIAHELAHTLQQRGGSQESTAAAPAATTSALEGDADRAAMGAMTALSGGRAGGLAAAVPQVRAGLNLSRCSKPKKMEICVQPVKIAEDDGKNPTTVPSFTKTEEIWKKCCIEFSIKGATTVKETDYKTLDVANAGTAEITALLGEVSSPDCIRVFVPETFRDPASGTVSKDVSGGGSSEGGAEPNSIVVEGADPWVVAHEIGHALGYSGHDEGVMKPTSKHNKAGSDDVTKKICKKVRQASDLSTKDEECAWTTKD